MFIHFQLHYNVSRFFVWKNIAIFHLLLDNIQ